MATSSSLQHPEPGNDAGLDGEALEKLLAEGVDGLDLQPARRVEGAGEQPARLAEVDVEVGITVEVANVAGEPNRRRDISVAAATV
jgi:hypothetical protein